MFRGSLIASVILSGCSATGILADALSGSGGVYSTDDDPELVRDAIPFALKTMEGVLVEEPEHVGLLVALASGFTQYAYAFVQQEADAMADEDIDRAKLGRARAKRLLLRARGYAVRALEVDHPGVEDMLGKDVAAALDSMTKQDVAALYWTAASWSLAISNAKGEPAMIADLPLAGAIARKALELDPTWNQGALHDFFIAFEAASPTGSAEAARKHFAAAVEISKGVKASPFVSLAESVCVKEQKRDEFDQLLDQALAVDVDAHPEHRLANTIMQRRARRLKAEAEDLFF